MSPTIDTIREVLHWTAAPTITPDTDYGRGVITGHALAIDMMEALLEQLTTEGDMS